MQRDLIGATLLALFLTMTSQSKAQTVLFDFDDGGVVGAAASSFDPGVVGDTATVGGLTATVVDVLAPEYDVTGALPVLTGNTLSAAGRPGFVSNPGVQLNISGQQALGINNPTVNNTAFDLIGDGSESSDMNPGEAWVFSFDQDVQFTDIELESVGDSDSFTVSVDGVVVLETTGDDMSIDDLGGLAGLAITAGSEITFAVDGVLETDTGGPATSVRVETFTVEAMITAPLLGDVNRDGFVDFLDITPFIAVVSGGPFQAEADVDESGDVDFLDIVPFIAILSGS